jgi:hypothetical protein
MAVTSQDMTMLAITGQAAGAGVRIEDGSGHDGDFR